MHKRMKTACILLSGCLIFTGIIDPSFYLAEETTSISESDILTEKQSNAINMLNYLRALGQEIRSSSSSRLYLEEAYNELDNNTNPSAVDSESLREVLNLLDDLEDFRMTTVKRERLQYLYEQAQAQSIRAAIPNPLGLLSLTRARSLPRVLLSAIYMAVDTIDSYQTAAANADMEYLKKGWELDEEGEKTLHKNITELYSYMVNMVNLYNLDGSLSLNNDAIEEYVSWKGNDNLQRKIQFFESKRDTYRAFGPYWLTLAECYYDNEDYQKCIDSIKEYEKLDIQIFRKDFDYAQTLPKVILACDAIMGVNEYAEVADNYCHMILNNTVDRQWDLKYFVAETYVDLYNRSDDEKFLKKAYEVVLNNVNYLVDEQKRLNSQYLSDVVQEKTPDGATKSQKEEVKQYNKMLKETRKVELAPIYNPLLINVDLLYTIANQLGIDDKEKSRIDMMIHGSDGVLFLVRPVNDLYSFAETEQISAEDIPIIFDGNTLKIPAEYVSDTAEITVKVKRSEDGEFTDWIVSEVNREVKDDFSTFVVTYESDLAEDYKYQDGDIVEVSIVPTLNTVTEPITCLFQAVREKAIGALGTWEWLDGISEWSDHFEFERITE